MDTEGWSSYLRSAHIGPRRHSVHVDQWPESGPDVAPAPRSMSLAGALALAARGVYTVHIPHTRRLASALGPEVHTAPEPAPEWLAAPAECAHGYTAPHCPDCDVPSYWPSALETLLPAPSSDTDSAEDWLDE